MPKIQLDLTFQRLTVTPAPMEVLESLLTVDDWSFHSGTNGRLERRPTKVRLFRRRGDVLRTSPCFMRRVHDGLALAGYSVDLRDRRRYEGSAAPELSFAAQLSGDDRQVTKALAAAFRGYVVAPTADLPRLIAHTCRLYPHSHILIPCDSRNKVDEIHAQLSKQLDEPVCKGVGKFWHPSGRIAVCDLWSFNTQVFLTDAVAIFPGAREILCESTRNNMVSDYWRRLNRKVLRSARDPGASHDERRRLEHQAETFAQQVDKLPPMATWRLYGLLPTTFIPTAYEQLHIEQVCGPELYRLYDDPRLQPAQVLFVHVASDATGRRNLPQVGKSLRAWQSKRQGVWHNEARNEAITSIASAFAAGDLAALWEHGLLLDAPQDWFQQQGRALRVNILVEVAEHARRLLQQLPGWQLAADMPATTAMPSMPTISFALPYYVDKHVVTAAYVERHGLDADVVIRADGLADRWNTRCGRSKARHQGPMLIVDVFDDHDERAVVAARRRIADYRRRGWSVTEPHLPTNCTQ